MNHHEEMIDQFYRSFQQRDATGMIACYHENIEFTDPVFLTLKGDEARAMWRMLIGRAKVDLIYRDVHADEQTGGAYWEATYNFTKTGRKVVNKVTSRFTFAEGKIIRQHDTFDLWKWSSMALGIKGTLLGGLPPVQGSIRKEARRGLDEFMAKNK